MALTKDKLRPVATDPANPETSTFTMEQLAISPLNVRFDEQACEKVDALAASIVAEGLLQSLVVHPAPPRAKWAGKAGFGVLAGGRRFRAISRAIAAGQLPADFRIRAIVRDLPPGEIIILSLIENVDRQDLQTFEICRGVARAHAEGLTVDQIAAKMGQKRRWVEQRLRLGELHPEIFAKFIAGEVTMDQAMAYAATEDRELQAAAWAHFTGSLGYAHTPTAIRTYLKVGDRELARNLLFVGEAIYRGNGGRFELDLFADGPDSMRGRVTDEQLLAKLVAEKLEVVRGQVRSAWDKRDLRFQAQPPRRAEYGGIDTELEVRPRKTDWETVRIPRGADPADFVATIEIDQEGGWLARLWWASRKAKAAFEKRSAKAAPDREGAAGSGAGESGYEAVYGRLDGGQALEHTNYAAGQEAKRVVRDVHGLTADGINVVRTVRRDLLRFALLCTPERDVPGDYLTWSALRQEFAGDRASRTGARGLAAEGWSSDEREPADLMKDQRDGQEGAALWADRIAILTQHPAFKLEDAADGLRAYFSASPAIKRTAESVLAGIALVRSAASPGWDVPAHAVLFEALGFSAEGLRNGWAPTAPFTGLFGKMARQEMVQPFVDEATRRTLAKAKDRDLSARTAEILAARKDWLHPLLAFALPEVDTSGYVEAVAPELDAVPAG